MWRLSLAGPLTAIVRGGSSQISLGAKGWEIWREGGKRRKQKIRNKKRGYDDCGEYHWRTEEERR